MKVLSIETSCDDTSVAIVDEKGFVHCCLSADQDLLHKPFGGIVPEIASRDHSRKLLPLIDQCLQTANVDWDSIDGLVVTNRPGLLGSLMVGVVTAKTLATTLEKPLVAVNHLEGHILAPFLSDEKLSASDLDFPFLALAASGGHSSFYDVRDLGEYRILGRTRDDAAGEAFDKFAKMLGLGFPGGVQVDSLAQKGDPKKFEFPRAMMKRGNFDLSFSGLKTAARLQLDKLEDWEGCKEDLCASFQQAIVDILIWKFNQLVEKHGQSRVVITGGVSANSCLRKEAEAWAQKKGVGLYMPPLRYCTDNAAMIGFAGACRLARGERADPLVGPSAQSYAEDWIES